MTFKDLEIYQFFKFGGPGDEDLFLKILGQDQDENAIRFTSGINDVTFNGHESVIELDNVEIKYAVTRTFTTKL